MMDYWFFIGIILSYLIGSVPTSVWVGKILFNKDVRNFGSGNAGATNTFRVLGVKAGLFVLIFDAFKGWAAVELYVYFIPGAQSLDFVLLYRFALAIAALIGHVYPLYAGFRGGKGVATLIGVMIALYPMALLIALGVFAFTLVVSRYVSLSSILASWSFPVIITTLYPFNSIYELVFALIIAVFIPFTHRGNIIRLVKGKENKIYFKKKKN